MSERADADEAVRAPVRGLATAAQIFAAIGAVALITTTRVITAGEHEIAVGSKEMREGDVHEAISRTRRAAGWYAPGAPHVRVAYERLIAIAKAAEAAGDRENALAAWRAVHSASVETRWIVTPHADDLARADQEIARLMALAPRPPGTRTDPPAEIQAKELEVLARDDGPRLPWIVALLVGALGWALGGLLLSFHGVSASGKLLGRRATPWIGLTAASIVLWLVAVWRA